MHPSDSYEDGENDPPGKKSTIQKIDSENLKPHEFGMGLMENVEGGAAIKLIKIAKESSIIRKTVVIGEDMFGRVIPFAEKNGFNYFKPRGTNPANWMKNQTKWMYRQIKDPSVRIIDIGSKYIETTSKYYAKEIQMLQKFTGYK